MKTRVHRGVDRVVARIEWLISNGELAPGDMLPVMSVFVIEYRCSEAVAKMARRRLARRGAISLGSVHGERGQRYVVAPLSGS